MIAFNNHNEESTNQCQCVACGAAIEQLHELEQEAYEKNGWIVHVTASFDSLSIHTHGLRQKYGQSELEMRLPLYFPVDIIAQIIELMIKRMEAGEVLKPDTDYDEILQGVQVRLVIINPSEDRLRIILPDRNGELNKDTIDPDFATQYE